MDKAMGLAKYTTDIVLPGMLYGKALRSPYAHATDRQHRHEQSREDQGRQGRGDGHQGHPEGRHLFGIIPHTRDHVLLPFDKVRYIGEEVAAVAAIDEDIAEEAIEAIKVEYEPLPFVLNWQDAMKEGAPLVHESRAGNMAAHYLVNEGDIEEALRNSDLVWEKTFTCEVASHALPEPFTALCSYEPSGKYNFWMQTQCPFQVRQGLHNTLKVPLSDIRLHSVDMGGAHGGRSDTPPGAFIAGLLSRKAGKPVQIKMSREEVEDCMRDKAAKVWTMKIGFKKDGTITGRDIHMMLEGGALRQQRHCRALGAAPHRRGALARPQLPVRRVPDIHEQDHKLHDEDTGPRGTYVRGCGV